MNKKIMVGIQSNGIPHLGNIISVILPTLSYIKNNNNIIYIMIADLHSLTDYKNSIILKQNIYYNAAVWLSFNINKYINNKVFFFRQSDIKEINILFWYLNCFYPFNRTKLFHIIKNKTKIKYNLGSINYPILMAADILLHDINKVIIGLDQIQHLEITRKIAKIFNNKLNKKIFKIPEYIIPVKQIIPGIDGQKMSKSLNNIINIYSEKDVLKKQIMNIKTSNESINKISYNNIKNTTLLRLYKIIADKNEYLNIKYKIKNNKIGFYNIKEKLYKYIIYKYKNKIKRFYYFLNNKKFIKKKLLKSYKKIRKISKNKINLIKEKIGLNI
ncbi:MAG: tryptophan--tRNA ligase [Candidatus Shikimatogenerans bostrichidophilus]|nr:MAG: tryptophan--tRNA ligase [Candidatus Shikimatogenerans bostrichidophilus]